jgi:hypothetical protein
VIIILPKGLRIEVVDNDNLSCPVGTKATLTCNETLDTDSFSKGVIALIDNDHIACMLPFDQCKIITDNFKKSFKPERPQ